MVAMVSDSESLVLTVPQAAKLLLVSKGSIYNAIKRGELQCALHIGRRVLISKKRLDEWLAGEGLNNDHA